MGKVIDITDKLSFDESPVIEIRDQRVEVNADAETVLRAMAALEEGTGAKQVISLYQLMFPEESRKIIEGLHLQFADFRVLVETAIQLVTGYEETTGNAQTHTTT